MQNVELVETAHTEAQYAAHESSADFLGKLASGEFGVELSDNTLSNWRQALRVILRVDNIFDSDNPTAKEEAVQSLRSIFMDRPELPIRGFDTETLNESLKLRNQIDTDQARNFVTKGLQVISIGQTMRSEESPRELARLTMLEGQMTTTMLVHLIDPQDKGQKNLPDFIRFLRIGSRAANVIDSIADLKTDYQEGISKVQPSFYNRVMIAWEVLPEVKKSISSLGMLAIVKRMPRATQKIIKDRHRKPENQNA
jgi:hypothetical protein